jgi:ABC-type transport system involved in cytochrome bd biosynthesis fused ATPase/permease subunit
MENITMGQTDINTKMIIQQADKLGFLNFLQYFPSGFDTILDPLGKKLSESLKKKILLIRATIGNKSLLLLEEPWNGLPSEMHLNLKNYFLNELPNVTVIIATNDSDYLLKCSATYEVGKGVILD